MTGSTTLTSGGAAAAPTTSTETPSHTTQDKPGESGQPAKQPDAQPKPQGDGQQQQQEKAGDKPESDSASDGGKAADGAAAPEALELKLPEGFEADEATLTEFKGIAKEAGLKGESAQKLVEFYAKAQKAAAERATQEAAALRAKWESSVKADKEVGGPTFDASVKHALGALKKYGTPELAEVLDATGLGSHPEFIRVFARIGKAMAEDSVSGTGGGTVATPANSEEAMYRQLYPTMFPNT